MSSRSWRTPDRGPLAQPRERFLPREPVEPHQVRDPILASWWRSRDWNVPADRIELSYVRDPDMDTPLTRSAMPVLRHLRENVEGQPISVILTDPAGVVLARLTADHDLERHLDGVKLAPGFSYAEELVGTNGIGTALEGGQPTHVFGHEHYAEHLEDLACAGVPIHHPITGKTVGAVDLTCWRKDADPLLVALVKTAADQITQALLADATAQELELLQEYQFLGGGVGQQGLGDLVRRRLHQGDEQGVGVLPPAGQVHRADRLAGDRMVDRHPGAGEILQVLRIVLVAEDVRGLAALQGGADAVGADEFLGVAEPRGELDPVEVPLQVM